MLSIPRKRIAVVIIRIPRTMNKATTARTQLAVRLKERMVRHKSGRIDITLNFARTDVSNKKEFVLSPVK